MPAMRPKAFLFFVFLCVLASCGGKIANDVEAADGATPAPTADSDAALPAAPDAAETTIVDASTTVADAARVRDGGDVADASHDAEGGVTNACGASVVACPDGGTVPDPCRAAAHMAEIGRCAEYKNLAAQCKAQGGFVCS